MINRAVYLCKGFDGNSMNYPIEEKWSIRFKKLKEREHSLEKQVFEIGNRYSGLKDINLTLELVNTRLSIALMLVERMSSSTREEVEKYHLESKKRAVKATIELENLVTGDLDDDDRKTIKEHPLYRDAREKIQRIILLGGGIFFEGNEYDEKKLRLVSKILVSSIRKFTKRDDLYPPPEIEKYPPLIRRIINLFFPILLKENQKPPPYGIEEGEERFYTSKNMRMPLSQAILFYEEEVLPKLKKKLESNPGNRGLQGEIERIMSLVEKYKKMKFIPRSTPIVMEKGFYDEWFTGFTRDGEMLVNVPVPVRIYSGNNTERLMELVRMDFVKRIAGRGVSRELDRHYRYLKSLESGIRGNSRTPSLKVNTTFGYQVLKREIPFLKIMEEKDNFLKLVGTVMNRRLKKPERIVLEMIREGQGVAGRRNLR